MTDSILVVDDDARLRSLLAEFLGEHGYDLMSAKDGATMDVLTSEREFNLLILDVNLPDESGMEICRRLREKGDTTPIIMLTARSEEIDRIQGLEFGADDYLPKPFNASELLARIKAVLRRHAHIPGAKAAAGPELFQFDNFSFDGRLNQLCHLGRPVKLSGTELALLKILLQHRGKAVSRTIISQQLRARDVLPDERTIDVIISRIRRKLGNRPDSGPYIQTIRSKGYMFLDLCDTKNSS